MAEPRGSVYLEVELAGRWAVWLLTEGWTDSKKRALLRGDEDAREALRQAALDRVLERPDELDERLCEIRLSEDPE